MLNLRCFRELGLTALVILAVILIGSANAAADSDTRKPRSMCRWDGTAPFCDGDCESGEKFLGAYATKEDARNDQPVVPGLPSNLSWQSFGKDCAAGKKAYCCFEFCPNGYTLIKGTCKNVSTKTRDLELPVPEAPVKLKKKGPIEAPSPIEGTEVNKGPIANPEQPYVTKRKTGPFVQD
jgi:hypothetical protein